MPHGARWGLTTSEATWRGSAPSRVKPTQSGSCSAPPHWHRLIGVGGFLLGTVAAFAAAVDFPGSTRPVGVVIGVALCVLAWRFWRLRIEADDESIHVVDWRRTTHVPWESIQRFSWDLGLAVLMRDGTYSSPTYSAQ